MEYIKHVLNPKVSKKTEKSLILYKNFYIIEAKIFREPIFNELKNRKFLNTIIIQLVHN